MRATLSSAVDTEYNISRDDYKFLINTSERLGSKGNFELCTVRKDILLCTSNKALVVSSV
jgi:hypothetical protein